MIFLFTEYYHRSTQNAGRQNNLLDQQGIEIGVGTKIRDVGHPNILVHLVLEGKWFDTFFGGWSQI